MHGIDQAGSGSVGGVALDNHMLLAAGILGTTGSSSTGCSH